MMLKMRRPRAGFTLIELLLVLTIIGLTYALVIPRAQRAKMDSNYSQIRQDASEIGSFALSWAQNRAHSQPPGYNYTVKDFLDQDISARDERGLNNKKLVDKYTGNTDYEVVEALIAPQQMPRNPFNEASYFDKVNNDDKAPSNKPGLLYLAARPDPKDKDYLNFYFLYTAESDEKSGARWFDGMNDQDDNQVRRGIFVARLYDDKEDGAPEPASLTGR
ncbi:MAG: type II secretion system GspH family protein [Proteobacteria bacterium]|nr:type II secretion system GspH family protein [Pseudomonadota bacterium]